LKQENLDAKTFAAHFGQFQSPGRTSAGRPASAVSTGAGERLRERATSALSSLALSKRSPMLRAVPRMWR